VWGAKSQGGDREKEDGADHVDPTTFYKKKSNILNHTNICVTTVTSLRCHPESVPFLLEIALDGSICNSYGDEWFVFSQKKRIVVAF
jgi:hypothetical protein